MTTMTTPPNLEAALDTQLSPMEQILLHTLTTGISNKNLARQLGKSQFTIRNQLSTIFKKLNATNRLQAVNRYREHQASLNNRKP